MIAGEALRTYKASFDVQLAAEFARRLQGIAERLGESVPLENIAQAVSIACTGGKRARPYLVETMYRTLGGVDDAMIVRAAVATEIFHVFCLVHDDVIDRAATRHGVPTVHAVAALRYGKAHPSEAAHNADGQAILVGDLLFSWAYSLMATCPNALSVFQAMIDDVVAGQMLDVDFTMRGLVRAEEAERKTQLKTASYTFIRPLQLGAQLAGANGDVATFCERFGMAVGSAFQLQDDYFDITATQEVLGKPVMNDIREGQQTPITAHFFAHASPADTACFLERFGHPFPSHDEVLVRDLLARAGSLAFAEQEIAQKLAQARSELAVAPVPQATKDALGDLVAYLSARTL